MQEFLRGEGIEIALGLAIMLLAMRMPFRQLASRPVVAFDIAAALATTAFAVAAEIALDFPADFIMDRVDGWYELIEDAPRWLSIPTYIVMADFGAYWAHRALHSRWLWSTHAWHHSPKYLYWVSGLRGSPVHLIVLYSPYYLAYILIPLPQAGLIGLALLVLDTSNQHYIHSNLRLPYARHLERLFVTPRFHFVHHSTTQSVANSNYGFIFSIWDRLFRTYTDPEAISPDDPLGLGYEISGWRLVLGLPPRLSLKPSGSDVLSGPRSS